MSEQREIVVVGATGSQGGGLARAILSDPDREFSVRALTRDVHSIQARQLADLGAHVVAADIRREGELADAFKGAYGAFCVTFYWDHLSPAQEKEDAAKQARAAHGAGVRHVIWSTLEDSRDVIPADNSRMPVLDKYYNVPHADSKAEANVFFENLGVPTTYLETAFYWENLLTLDFGIRRNPEGALQLGLPTAGAPLSGIAAEDIGRTALGVFKQGLGTVGQKVGIAGEHLTGAEMAATLQNVLGEKVLFAPMEPTFLRSLGFPGSGDLANMFQYQTEASEALVSARSVRATRELNPRLMDFEAWARLNKGLILGVSELPA
ncbi:NmrA/HSCARG family protein [Streptomyces globisporus]|uniref:NmrA/HSCARG family protein n=1 Tax=Streptomyces globisporus TaxID=1908 RepID=UPI00382A6E8E